MKKILLLSALVLFGSHQLMGQGSVLFQNTTVSTPFYTNTEGGGLGRVTTAPGTVAYALFYSDATTGGVSNNLTFATAVGNSTGSYGVIQGNSVLALPGTNPGDQAWIMVLAWDGVLGLAGYTNYIGPYGSGPAGNGNGQWSGGGKYFLQTRTILVTLGPAVGPGGVMFQQPGDANHLGGIPVFDSSPELVIDTPEPTSFGMVIASSAVFFYFRRRRR